VKKSKENSIKLKKLSERCLYLDEIIDIKFIGTKDESEMPKYALLCSNNEYLKVLDLDSGSTELVPGHKDIIICLDLANNLMISGAKDNEIRLWSFNSDLSTKVNCIAVFKGHN
jgi:WD40 repeat protein